jgi:DNA primase catalytic core
MSDSTSFKASVAEVKLAYNIVDYIQSSGIKLKQNGATKWKGLCPFHNEKSPSFSVDEHFQNYRCFGCNASGDLISFVEKTENLEFFDAIRKLAEDKGIDLKLEASEDALDYKSLKACIKAAANFYLKEFKKLSEDHPARKQIKERGLSFGKVRYGYAPEGRQTLYKHLKEQGFSDEIISKTGVCLQFKGEGELFDFWHGRLMFFITDITGKPVGFSGRKLYETDKRGKYVNSPDGPLFDKSSVLYNIDTAKKMIAETKSILVVEGQFDVSAYVEAGMLNVVASSGTAFTEKQAMICRRITGENGKIIFCFDGDSAGSNAAEKVFRNVPMIHSQAYVVSFPEGQDPCDYRLEHGDEALEEYTKKAAKPIVEFVLDLAKKDFDLDSSVGRSRYLEKAAQILKTVASISLRDAFVKKVALDSFTSVDIVREVVTKAEPLESGSHAAKPEAEVETRPVLIEETEVDLDEVIKLIKDDALYNVSARIMALSLADSRFSSPLRQLLPIIPEELRRLAEEIGNITHTEGETAKALIPEMFKNSELAAYLISTDLFPLSHMMDLESMKNHFKYLRKTLKKEFVTRAEEGVRLKISRILEASNSVDSEFLMKAIQKEEQELEKLKQSFQ